MCKNVYYVQRYAQLCVISNRDLHFFAPIKGPEIIEYTFLSYKIIKMIKYWTCTEYFIFCDGWWRYCSLCRYRTLYERDARIQTDLECVLLIGQCLRSSIAPIFFFLVEIQDFIFELFLSYFGEPGAWDASDQWKNVYCPFLWRNVHIRSRTRCSPSFYRQYQKALLLVNFGKWLWSLYLFHRPISEVLCNFQVNLILFGVLFATIS